MRVKRARYWLQIGPKSKNLLETSNFQSINLFQSPKMYSNEIILAKKGDRLVPVFRLWFFKWKWQWKLYPKWKLQSKVCQISAKGAYFSNIDKILACNLQLKIALFCVLTCDPNINKLLLKFADWEIFWEQNISYWPNVYRSAIPCSLSPAKNRLVSHQARPRNSLRKKSTL